jgi:hypothetical protein
MIDRDLRVGGLDPAPGDVSIQQTGACTSHPDFRGFAIVEAMDASAVHSVEWSKR